MVGEEERSSLADRLAAAAAVQEVEWGSLAGRRRDGGAPSSHDVLNRSGVGCNNLGTGLGDRFEVSQGSSGSFEGGMRQADETA